MGLLLCVIILCLCCVLSDVDLLRVRCCVTELLDFGNVHLCMYDALSSVSVGSGSDCSGTELPVL